ncbi:nitronate monooxygenase [Cytobacillus sp. IB215665]|uniref:NAD(P)H-dependent flavin oxidoreductase n=1 Tax=Cytobacillus sp. IB215665 TaxID=3097357 RepID=UPI002A12D241|nr:nitronate monooxygenase [Cytobacillus sp. IB215665]MDX8364471.1 nitronate monooxygenase [Cytobacillus sp. IB215665]
MNEKLPKHMTTNLTLPVISAPMFLISSPKLVIESCKLGVIGSFPTLNARTVDILEDWMAEISSELAIAKKEDPQLKVAPWAVNFIVHQTNPRYEEDLRLITKYQPPIVITSLGNPSAVVEIVHHYGGLVFADVSNIPHARKAAKTGVDGLILVCSGAGGHAGTINSFAFAGEVRKFWDGITVLAGCITTGRDILAVEALGMDMAYIGTRFISAKESFASRDYRDMLINASVDDLIYTDAISGVYANYLKESILNAGIDINVLEKKQTVDFSFMNQTNAKAWKDIFSAGQGVGQISKAQTVAEIIEEMQNEYHLAKDSLTKSYV